MAEEAGEVIIAAKNREARGDHLRNRRSAVSHALVLGYHDVTLGEVYRELGDRFGKSGIRPESGGGRLVDNCIFVALWRGPFRPTLSSRMSRCWRSRTSTPQAPVHVLVIPKRHVAAVQNCGDGDQALLGQLLLTCAEVARARKLTGSGYRIVTNTGRIVGRPCFISTCMCSAEGHGVAPGVSGSPTSIDTCADRLLG